MQHSSSNVTEEEERVPLLHEEKKNPFRSSSAMHKIARNPCTQYCYRWLFFLALLIIMFLLPEALISVDGEFPFYNRGNEATIHERSIIQGKAQASDDLTSTGGSTQEREEKEFTLEILYIAKNGDAITTKHLKDIQKMEREILFEKEYTDYCALNYDFDENNPICYKHDSPINFFAPDYWLPLNYSQAMASAINEGLIVTTANLSDLSPTAASEENYQLGALSRLWELQVNTSDTDQMYNYYVVGNPYHTATGSLADVNDENFVEAVRTYWGMYCDPSQDCTSFEAMGWNLSSPFAFMNNGTNSTQGNEFWNVVDSGFGFSDDGNLNLNVKALKSTFYYGSPRKDKNGNLYNTEGSDYFKQLDDVGEYLFNEIQPIMDEGVDGFKIYFSNTENGMVNTYIIYKLVQDGMLAIGAFFFVLIYLTLMNGSFYLGGMGMFMVVCNFLPAAYIYKYIAGFSYFGTLNFMAIFIILGIGADDIFVFLDTYRAMKSHLPRETPYHSILYHTLKRSGKAMLTTSLSTSLSFLANANSSIPAIYTFGSFCAILILCNFVSVIIMWPAGVAVYEYYINTEAKDDLMDEKEGENKKKCHYFSMKPKEDWGFESAYYHHYTTVVPISDANNKQGEEEGVELKKLEQNGTSERSEKDSSPYDPFPSTTQSGSGDALFDETKTPGTVEKFFRDTYYPFIHKYNKLILAAFGVLFIVYISLASQLEPDPEQPQIFPDDDPYQAFYDIREKYFQREDSLIRVNLQVVFGIEELDQDTCEGKPCVATSQNDLGTVIFNDNVNDVANPYGQKFLLDMCHDIEFGDDAQSPRLVYEADSILPTPVKCVFQSFQHWCEEKSCCSQTHSSLDSSDYICDEDEFWSAFDAFLVADQLPSDNDYVKGNTNADVWGDYVFVEEIFDQQVFRFFSIGVSLSVDYNYQYEKGIELYEDWNDWLSKWIDAQRTSIYNNIDSDFLSTAFVGDEIAFSYFYIQRQILREALFGIMLSLSLAFIVLCFATANWYVSLFSIFNIGTMVLGTMAFTVMSGNKLGIVESILFIMVVGLSVDYCVHLADAYLESEHATREERTRSMLYVMGVSVLSGAISTLGASFFLLFAYIKFMSGFGNYIFFIIFQSIIFSLLPFTAALDLFGPQRPLPGQDLHSGTDVDVILKKLSKEQKDRIQPLDLDRKGRVRSKITEMNSKENTAFVRLPDEDEIELPTYAIARRKELGSLLWVYALGLAIEKTFLHGMSKLSSFMEHAKEVQQHEKEEFHDIEHEHSLLESEEEEEEKRGEIVSGEMEESL